MRTLLVANSKPLWNVAVRRTLSGPVRPATAAKRADVKVITPAARIVQSAPWTAQSAYCPGWRAGSSSLQSAAGPTQGSAPGSRTIDGVTDAAGADVADTASADAADDMAASVTPTAEANEWVADDKVAMEEGVLLGWGEKVVISFLFVPGTKGCVQPVV